MKFSVALVSAFFALPGALAAPTLKRSCKASNSSSTVPTKSTSNTTKVAASWITGWHMGDSTPAFDVSNVTWSNYTHLTYSFAETTPSADKVSLASSDETNLKTFVAAAHQNNVKALLSIGGWTGSIYFSNNVGSAANRTAFVKTSTDLVTKYGLDGLDFDWEYPSSPNGLSCNVVNKDDTANYLAFFQELRNSTIGKNITLTATAVTPWNDVSEAPSTTGMNAFAEVLDWVSIMDYDVWGPGYSSSVGPNAPLDDACAAKDNQLGSASSYVKAWVAAGFPASKLVLGLASYGHGYSVSPTEAFGSSSSKALMAYPKYNENANVTGDAWDLGPLTADPCGNPGTRSGVFDFWGLVDGGYLLEDGSPNTAADISYRFDNCSQTAYVYNSTAEIMVSYDDVPAMTAKGQFIASQDLLGFAFWETGGDYKNILLSAARTGMGI
ncbi:hypothetical protein HWV62_31509 [Athelia sp. TMB]|nr:hypothetical protein HWV62_31509 [Athelia sp. TMB]